MKHSLSLLLALSLGIGFAQTGQMGPYVTRTYDLRELVTRPALVAVSPNYLTVLDFEDTVDEVASGRPELMNVEVRENLILLRSAKNAGATDLVVKVSGRVALFRVRIDPASYNPRRYLIRFPEPPATLGTGDGPGYTAPRPWLRPIPPTPAKPTLEVPSGTAPPDPSLPEVTEEPGWLPLSLAAYTGSGGDLYVTVVAENRGKNPAVFDGVRLKLYTLQGGEKVPIPFKLQTLGSGAYEGRVYAGQTYSALLLAKNVPQREIWLEWTATEIGPGRTYTFKRRINAGAQMEIQPPAR